ncbi:MAG: S41 family peptidase [Bacteroidota bacterium]
MVNKRLQVWLPLLFSVVMVMGILIGYQLQEAMGWKKNNASKGMNNTTSEVLALINEKYVDKVDTDSMNYDAIQAILNRLDPHSVYIAPLKLDDVNNDLRGNFQGIGIEYQVYNDTLNVLYVVDKGPAAVAGIQVGDQLIKAGDSIIAGKRLKADAFRKLFRGEGGSEVVLTLYRNNKPITVKVKRGIIPIPSLDAAYMAAPGVGYIRLNKFAEVTYIEFMQAMDKLKPLGMKKLILDLRSNGGGVLEAAVNIADEFLPDGKMIVYTEGNKVKRREFKSSKPGVFEEGELVLLMDEFSASASEVLAGALQDNDRCTIVGRRSFGKGLVQEQYGLSDGGALRLTVARYYTPLGRSIQKPYNKGRKVYGEELLDRFHHRDSLSTDSAFTRGKSFKTKKGKTLYDGGGITPDVYVAMDTATVSEDLGRLLIANTLSNFTYQLYKQNKPAFDVFKNAAAFDTVYNLPASTWILLVDFAKKDSINLALTNTKLQQESLRRIKALLARQLYRNEGYYEVENNNSPTYKKAVEIITH